MANDDGFPGIGDLRGAAALSWGADCVEHLSHQVGDTANGDVAACVRFARKYVQDRVYDPAEAWSLAKAARRARRKLGLTVGRVAGTAFDVGLRLAGVPYQDVYRPPGQFPPRCSS